MEHLIVSNSFRSKHFFVDMESHLSSHAASDLESWRYNSTTHTSFSLAALRISIFGRRVRWLAQQTMLFSDQKSGFHVVHDFSIEYQDYQSNLWITTNIAHRNPVSENKYFMSNLSLFHPGCVDQRALLFLKGVFVSEIGMTCSCFSFQPSAHFLLRAARLSLDTNFRKRWKRKRRGSWRFSVLEISW